ncbi:nucleotidyltransferase family protein [Micromonospora aurantiaca]|nr:nucleotidyltransferase family protein [Micromonospora aurantiaca]
MDGVDGRLGRRWLRRAGTAGVRICKAVIPAAGTGSRLWPLTATVPKPMLPIGRTPILEHVISNLRMAGIEEVMVVVDFRRDAIMDYFGDGKALGVDISYVVQGPDLRGSAGAILHAAEWIGDSGFMFASPDCYMGKPATNASPLTALQRLVAAFEQRSVMAIALTEWVPRQMAVGAPALNIPLIASTAADPQDRDPFPIDLSAPAPVSESGRLSVLVPRGYWALSPDMLDVMRRTPVGPDGEVRVSSAARLVTPTKAVWAAPMWPGECSVDIGDWSNFLRISALAAVQDEEYGPEIVKFVSGELSGHRLS